MNSTCLVTDELNNECIIGTNFHVGTNGDSSLHGMCNEHTECIQNYRLIFFSCSQASSRAAQKRLKEGMVFAFDGFHAWTLDSGGTKTMSEEEMAGITENGAEYLIAPQEELVLVG